MKTDVFPINYFRSIGTPIQAFTRRKKLGWPGIIVILFFLNALMTIPVTVHFARMESYPLEQVYPEATQLILEHPVDGFQAAEYENGRMETADQFLAVSAERTVAAGVDPENVEGAETEGAVVWFHDTHFTIQEEGLPTSTVPYTDDFSLKEVSDGEDVVQEMSRQWFAQNQLFLVAFFSLLLSFFLFAMVLFLVFGSAVFLYATKSSTLTSITTYKESVNLLLNSLGIPTLAAMVIGLIQFDIVWMLMVQTIGLVLMLLIQYYKTQFNDEKANTVVQE